MIYKDVCLCENEHTLRVEYTDRYFGDVMHSEAVLYVKIDKYR